MNSLYVNILEIAKKSCDHILGTITRLRASSTLGGYTHVVCSATGIVVY